MATWLGIGSRHLDAHPQPGSSTCSSEGNGQLVRDFLLKHLRVIHAQRVGIPRGADHPSSVAATAPLKQTVALQIPRTFTVQAPMTRRGRGTDVAGAHSRRGSFPARGSNRPVPRALYHVDRKQGLHVQRHIRVRQVSGGENTHVHARLFPRTDVQATGV